VKKSSCLRNLWLISLLAFCAASPPQSTSPEITKSIGRVSWINGCMKTAAKSRAEVKIKDVTVRVGANTLCCFDVDGNMKLRSGVVFFSKTKKLRGDVQTDQVIVIGSDFLISNVGMTKVVALKRRIGVGFVDKPAKLTMLSQGQMLAIEPGERVMPKKTEINLEALLSSSMLGEAGGLGAFPNQPAVATASEGAPPAINATRATQTAQATENIVKQEQHTATQQTEQARQQQTAMQSQQATAAAAETAQQATAQQAAAQQAALAQQAAADRAFLAQQRRQAQQQAAQTQAAQAAAAAAPAPAPTTGGNQGAPTTGGNQGAPTTGGNQGNRGNQGKHLGQMK
jgi:hypothetical protein